MAASPPAMAYQQYQQQQQQQMAAMHQQAQQQGHPQQPLLPHAQLASAMSPGQYPGVQMQQQQMQQMQGMQGVQMQGSMGNGDPNAAGAGFPGNIDREKLAAMSQRMAQLRQQGFTEQTSPELGAISQTLNAIQRQMAKIKQSYIQQQAQQQQQQQQHQLQTQGYQNGTPGQAIQPYQPGFPSSNGHQTNPSVNNMAMQNGQANAGSTGQHARQQSMQDSPAAGRAASLAPAEGDAQQQQSQSQQQQQQPSSAGSTLNSSLTQHATLTPQQMAAFKAQIFALRFLQRGMPIPPAVASVIFRNGSSTQAASEQSAGTGDSPSDPLAAATGAGAAGTPGSAGIAAGPSSAKETQRASSSPDKPEMNAPVVPTPDGPLPAAASQDLSQRVSEPEPEQEQEPELEIEEMPDTLIAPYNAYRNPRTVLAALRSAAQQQQERTDAHKTPNVPSLLPHGLDAHTLQLERNKFIEARMAQRRRELENLPVLIGDGPELDDVDALEKLPDGKKAELLASQKLKAIIELKSLNLLQRQRQLREDVVKGLNQAVSLNLVTDRTVYRAQRRITLKDARIVDQLERQQKIDRENRAKQKHLDQLLAIAKHGQALEQAHQANKQRQIKLGKSIMRWHVEAEKEEQKRIERISKERLKALRNNDEEAYLRLIDTAKDTRITHLLRQTDSFLEGLAQAVVAQQEDASEKDPMAVDTMREEGGDVKQEEMGEAQFGAAPVFQDEPAEAGNKVDYYAVAHKIKEEVTKQPTILSGGQLKEYQLKGLQWMISLYNNRLNGILADEMGLGKTIQTISLITYLIEVKRQPGPYLCIVPLSTLPNWMLEFEKWAPSVQVITYKGSPPVRKSVQNQMKLTGFQVCLTTYEYIIKDRPFLCRYKWVHMIIDEGHRMKNANSKLSQTLTAYYSSRYRLILTGTPLQNNLPELWALLNFVLPKVFNSQKSFDEWFNTPFAGTGSQDKIDLNEEEALLVIRRLHKVLRPFLLRRLKRDVESELPDKVERLVRCKMSALQLKLYKQMKDTGMIITQDGGATSGSTKLGMKGLQNTIMQLRKICNHPFVFRPVEDLVNPHHLTNELLFRVCGKFELLDRILPKLFSTGHRILMFFQMTEIMNIMEDYLRYRNTIFLRLDGSTKPDERAEMLAQFNHPASTIPIFLLSTRAGGLGLNLQVADTVIIYDSDWNPHQDLQAQDRAHRIGQKKEVRIFRLVTEKSIEENILARARQKLEIDKKVIQGGRFDNKSSASEREEFLRGLLEANEEDDEDTADLGDEEINDMLARSEEESEIFTKMDLQRGRDEGAEWVRQGNRGPVRERLITEAELPQVYHIEHTFEPVVEEVLEERRKGKVIHYDDGLTEEQWTQAIDNNVDMNELVERNRKARVSQNYGYLDEDGFSTSDNRTRGNSTTGDFEDSEAGSPGPGVKKRKRVGGPALAGSRATSVDTGSVSGEFGGKAPAAAKRRKTGKANLADDPGLRQLKETMDAVIDVIEDVDNEDFGHQCCGLFYKLPSKKDYPEYFIMIPRPICLNDIKKKVDKWQYHSLDDFISDFRLMFNNAKTFNDDSSVVYKDTISMERAFDEKLAQLTGGRYGNAAVNAGLAAPAPAPAPAPIAAPAPMNMGMPVQHMNGGGSQLAVQRVPDSDDDDDDDDDEDD